MKKNSFKKIIIVLLLIVTLTGCTKQLKTEDNKVVQNEKTGQSITENILCRPTSDELIKIYEENGKDLSKLPECNKMPIGGEYEGLWTNIFVKPLAFIIIKLAKLVGNAGLSLIIVTFAIRLLLFPLTRKTAMQSEVIKEAQPELTRIEKKYADKTDQESQNQKAQEMMMVYKKYNINPLSGCLFALIQLPLLFAFLEAINRVPAIFEGKFLYLEMGKTPWVAITSGAWYYIILVILIVGTTFLSFKMNKSTASPELEKQNKMTMIFMTVFIGFASFTLPTAIAIYWITSSAFTILQNLITDKSLRRRKK